MLRLEDLPPPVFHAVCTPLGPVWPASRPGRPPDGDKVDGRVSAPVESEQPVLHRLLESKQKQRKLGRESPISNVAF
ncbi:hypothetical protein VULLAG_LOCUS6320 [Vulpes lagopus]